MHITKLAQRVQDDPTYRDQLRTGSKKSRYEVLSKHQEGDQKKILDSIAAVSKTLPCISSKSHCMSGD